eukprot:RCo033284
MRPPPHGGVALVEVVLLVLGTAGVVYDLYDTLASKPSVFSSSSVPGAAIPVLSFEAEGGAVELPGSFRGPLDFIPVTATDGLQAGLVPSLTVDSAITSTNTFTVCGNTTAPANPWVVGTATQAQALVVVLGGSGSCGLTPAILRPSSTSTNSSSTTTNSTNSTNSSANSSNSSNTSTTPTATPAALAGISVLSGSWLSIQGVQPGASAQADTLLMASGAVLELTLSQSVTPIPNTTTTLLALRASGSCPSSTGISLKISNCPNDTSLASLGTYSCTAGLSALVSGGLPVCHVSLNIIGPLTVEAGQYLTLTMGKDCGTFSQDMFRSIVAANTGVPQAAILVQSGSWACGSVQVSMTVLASTQALAMDALTMVYQSAVNGTLNAALAVITATLGSPTTTTTTTSKYSSYSNVMSTTWFFPSRSSSNHA